MARLIGMLLALSWAASAGQTAYRISTIAGGGAGSGDGGPALQATLQQAEGVAVDAAGNLYVAEALAHRVRRITPSGVIDTIAGNGVAGFSGDGGSAAAAQLDSPYGLAVTNSGVLYIADLGNQRIRRVAADGRITTVAGGGATPLSVWRDGQPATSVQLKSPRNVAVDADGSLVLSDFQSNRVARMAPDGNLTIVAGTGVAGVLGDGGPATASQLSSPAGIAFDANNNLYIADSGNKRVRRITKGVIETLSSAGKRLVFESPTGVSIDSAGALYVADAAAGACTRIPATGAITTLAVPARDVTSRGGQLWLTGTHEVWQWLNAGPKLVAGNGTADLFGDGGAALKARLASPAGVAVDGSGNVYMADSANHCVRRVDSRGIITTIAGTGQAGFSGDNGPANAARLQSPSAVALDRAGNLYVSDTGNHRVRRIARNGAIATLAGSGLSGRSGDGGLAVNAQLNGPTGLVVDSDGALFIADTGNHVIRKLTAAGVIDTVVGSGVAGFAGDGAFANRAQLNHPTGLGIETTGGLLIADTDNHAVRRVSPTGVITTVADITPSRWNAPQSVTAGPTGEFYVGDSGNGRVAMISAKGEVFTIAGGGEDATDADRLALKAKLSSPRGIALDSSGALYLTDGVGNRLYRMTTVADEPATLPPATPPASLAPLSFRVVNAASYQQTSLVPGQLVTLFGEGIGPGAAKSGAVKTDGTLSAAIDGYEVWFDATPAPMFYAGPGQITVQVPYALNGRTFTDVSLVTQGVQRGLLTVPVAATGPAFFTIAGGSGIAAALNEDGSLNSAANPAVLGSVVTLFGTGEGQTSPGGQTGRTSRAPYAVPAAPISAYVGGQPAEVVWAGAAPGLIGVFQVNVRLPLTLTRRGAADVMLVVGDASSPPGVVVAVR